MSKYKWHMKYNGAKQGYQPDGLFLSMNDNGDYYLSLNAEGDGNYVEV